MCVKSNINVGRHGLSGHYNGYQCFGLCIARFNKLIYLTLLLLFLSYIQMLTYNIYRVFIGIQLLAAFN